MRVLPVGAAVNHMLSSTYNNIGFALRAQWPWMAITAVVFTGFGVLFPEVFVGNSNGLENSLQNNPGKVGGLVLMLFASMLVALVAFSSCAVAWHRYVLLDEVPQGMAKLRVDGTVWRYLGNLFLIGLILMLPTIPLALIIVPLVSTSAVLGIFCGLAYSALVIVPILYRLSIKLPGVALGRRDFRISDAWAASDGNWWQLAAVGFLVSGISWLVGLALKGFSYLVNSSIGGPVGLFLDLAAQVGVNWVVTIMGITLLTSLYGFFVEKREF